MKRLYVFPLLLILLGAGICFAQEGATLPQALSEAFRQAFDRAAEVAIVPCVTAEVDVELGVAMLSGQDCPLAMRSWLKDYLATKKPTENVGPFRWIEEVASKRANSPGSLPSFVSMSFTFQVPEYTGPAEEGVRLRVRRSEDWKNPEQFVLECKKKPKSHVALNETEESKFVVFKETFKLSGGLKQESRVRISIVLDKSSGESVMISREFLWSGKEWIAVLQ